METKREAAITAGNLTKFAQVMAEAETTSEHFSKVLGSGYVTEILKPGIDLNARRDLQAVLNRKPRLVEQFSMFFDPTATMPKLLKKCRESGVIETDSVREGWTPIIPPSSGSIKRGVIRVGLVKFSGDFYEPIDTTLRMLLDNEFIPSTIEKFLTFVSLFPAAQYGGTTMCLGSNRIDEHQQRHALSCFYGESGKAAGKRMLWPCGSRDKHAVTSRTPVLVDLS